MAKTIRSADFRLTARQILQAKNRPQTEPWEDWVTMGLSVVTLFAVFWDGWLHNNSTTLDSFWSSAHIMMYLGLTSLGAWIGLVYVKRQPKGRIDISMNRVPQGYGLALVALPLAALGGPGDFAWHAAYGFENQIDAPFSPTHQMLFLAGALLAGIGLGSTWHRKDGRRPGMGLLWPAVISLSAIVAVIEFTFMNLLPYFWVMVPTTDFQNDIKSGLFIDAYKPGTGVKHVEGLADSAAHYGDHAFNYYLFSNMQIIGGIMIFTAAFVGAILYFRRRWVLPFGAITLMCTLLSLLFPFFTRFQYPEMIPALIVTGLLVDLLARSLINDDFPSTLRIRLFAGLLPIAIWLPWELAIALAHGIGWGPTVFIGIITTSCGVGYGISLLVTPPKLPEVPAEAAA